ncbi:MAG: T9SS type A sorting domain-containing protein [Flavitalea sp.]
MLKGLLLIMATWTALIGYSQVKPADLPDISDTRIEDPNSMIFELTHQVKENTKVSISWKLRDSIPEFFAIERSDNGKSYEVVSVLNNLSAQPFYTWIDDAPKKGKSFYRIRYSLKDGQSNYSKTISCLIEGLITFKFYPNPVDQILIVRSEIPIDVYVLDPTGKIRITQPKVNGLQTINVSSLEKGIYLIRFVDKLSNTISQEKLLKN